MTQQSPLWQPSVSAMDETLMAEFMKKAGQPDFAALHAWSVAQTEDFWRLAWDFCGLQGAQGHTTYIHDADPLKAQFFPEATLNVVETFLKNPDDRPAISFIGENGQRRRWTRAELKREVEQLAAALKAEGIGKGDRVAGYVPNMPQTVAVMLATASLGAVWSSCAPESGPDVVVDRFDQIEPKLMFTVDGYTYGGKRFQTAASVAEILRRVPSIKKVVTWNFSGGESSYEAFKRADAPPLVCEPMGFRDPLYVMFSSGTTGKPKCIEHSGGGTLLRMMVEHQLHCDIKPGDRVFYYTTTNWMMWNWLIGALASEAEIILYDGNPSYPDIDRLFALAESERFTHMGVSAKYIDGVQKQQHKPNTHDLSALRVVLSTGSPLSPEGFAHVYADWKADVQLASICGGTDILGVFVGGCPILPVYQGEIPCAALGLDVDTLGEDAEPVTGVPGELACRNAHPSMPTRFLNDPDNARYRAAYYEPWPRIWRQGDFALRTEHGGFIVLGRSDATLNPGGVRIGTAEIYRQLTDIDEIVDAVVVGQSYNNDTRVLLFVMLAAGATLDDALMQRVKLGIRQNASPRHVPAKIIAVADIPRTHSGKIAELAVRDIVNQQPVRNLTGLANPEALALFKAIPELADGA